MRKTFSNKSISSLLRDNGRRKTAKGWKRLHPFVLQDCERYFINNIFFVSVKLFVSRR